MAILALVAAITAWKLLSEAPARRQSGHGGGEAIDYFMADFTTTVMNRGGWPRYRLTGATMVHYPGRDILKIMAPRLVFYDQATPRWKVVAEKALTNGTGEIIHLLGEVVIRQLGVAPGTTPTKIITQDVRVKPKAKFAETSQPVTIVNGFGKTHAVGARFYLQEKRIELLSQVRGIYGPEPSHPP